MTSPLISSPKSDKIKRIHIYIDRHGEKFRTTLQLENYYCDALKDAFGIDTPVKLKEWLQSLANTWDKNDTKGIGGFIKCGIIKALTLALLDERNIKSISAPPVASRKFVKSSSKPVATMTPEDRDELIESRMQAYYLLEKKDLHLSITEKKAMHTEMVKIIGAMKKKVGIKAVNYFSALSELNTSMSVFLEIATKFIVAHPNEINSNALKAHFMNDAENGAMSYTAGTAAAQATNCIALFKALKLIVKHGERFELNEESLLLEKAKRKLGL